MSEVLSRPTVRRSLRRAFLKSTLAVAAVSGVGLVSISADAHHSFAMFDNAKTVTVTGTVEQYRWQMPHVWIYMTLPQSGGKVIKWSGECHAPNIIARKGWNRQTLKQGDRISVTMHPMRDGSQVGSVISIKLPDGTVLWNADSKNSF